uniref:Cytochrome P450 n=1 Tax=Acrobeloides nanus TaxID=290746 RepID=A0A914DX68_9BILA
MLDERRKDKDAAKKHQDFFQLLINVVDELNQDEIENKEDSDIIHEEIVKSKKKGLSKIELLGQAFIVLNAGYETTATTLQNIVYIIAKLPEIQEKMRDEIMEVIGDKAEIVYEDLSKLKYINQVVQETLRMYPPAPRPTRLCTKPITVKGIRFEKNVSFSIPIYSVHYDENYYPDPYTFDPDRFRSLFMNKHIQ